MTGKLVALFWNSLYIIGVLILRLIDYISADAFVISIVLLGISGIWIALRGDG